MTTSIALGTGVLNTGVRHPLDIASDFATLDRFSPGRILVGLGAGHTPAEWAAIGEQYPSPAERINRLEAVTRAVARLLAGETVDLEGPGFVLDGAKLEFAPPRQVPLLIGGNSRRLVKVAATMADIVEIGGLGRTLSDGHFHEVRWRPHQIDDIVAVLDQPAVAHRPRLGALVQLVAVTEDAERTAARFLASVAERQPPDTLPTIDELLAAPFVLIGTISEIANQLLAARDRWGFTRYTIRTPAIDDIAAVMTEISGRMTSS